MKSLVCSVVVGWSAVSAAQPAAKQAPQCVAANGEPRLVIAGTTVTGCWSFATGPDKCFAFPAVGLPTSVAPTPVAPVSATAITEVRDEHGKLSACAGKVCKTLGKNALAAIAKLTAEGEGRHPKVTEDLKAVVVGSSAWNVASDKALVLARPAQYKKTDEAELLGDLDVMGKILLASWGACAGPCAMAVVVDASGANKGTWFPAGTVIRLDDKRAAILPDQARGELTVLDVTSGKHLGSLKLVEGVLEGAVGARLDDKTLVAIWHGPGDAARWSIVWIAIPAGKPPAISASRELPDCP